MTNQPLTFTIPAGFGEPETDAQFVLDVQGWSRASGDERCTGCPTGLAEGELYAQLPEIGDTVQYAPYCRGCAVRRGEQPPVGRLARLG